MHVRPALSDENFVRTKFQALTVIGFPGLVLPLPCECRRAQGILVLAVQRQKSERQRVFVPDRMEIFWSGETRRANGGRISLATFSRAIIESSSLGEGILAIAAIDAQSVNCNRVKKLSRKIGTNIGSKNYTRTIGSLIFS